MSEKLPDSTNYLYVDHDDVTVEKKVFINHLNSYHASALVQKIYSENVKQCGMASDVVTFSICGTWKQSEDCRAILEATLLDPTASTFCDSIMDCDVVIFNISQDSTQLWEARKFVKHFEQQLKAFKVDKKKQFILVSTIMTWAQTRQNDEVLNDLNYPKRRPHPSFVEHTILEHDVMELATKFEMVSSIVVCPGIIYGGQEDIFHFIYNECYFNRNQLSIFAPGTNCLPLIYIEDFTRIMMSLIRKLPEELPYVVAVQPETLQAKDVVTMLAEAAGGPEMKIKVCAQDEIFVMDEKLMTVIKCILESRISCCNQINFSPSFSKRFSTILLWIFAWNRNFSTHLTSQLPDSILMWTQRSSLMSSTEVKGSVRLRLLSMLMKKIIEFGKNFSSKAAHVMKDAYDIV